MWTDSHCHIASEPDTAEQIAAARAAGCTVVDGLEALVRQGARSFELWTGEAAPTDVMRSAVGARGSL